MIYESIQFEVTTLMPKTHPEDKEKGIGRKIAHAHSTLAYLRELGLNISLSTIYKFKKPRVYFVPKEGFENLRIFSGSDKDKVDKLYKAGYDFHVRVERI